MRFMILENRSVVLEPTLRHHHQQFRSLSSVSHPNETPRSFHLLAKDQCLFWQAGKDCARLLIASFGVAYHLTATTKISSIIFRELMGPRCTKTPEEQLRA
jgi:hypothetical protein